MAIALHGDIKTLANIYNESREAERIAGLNSNHKQILKKQNIRDGALALVPGKWE